MKLFKFVPRNDFVYLISYRCERRDQNSEPVYGYALSEIDPVQWVLQKSDEDKDSETYILLNAQPMTREFYNKNQKRLTGCLKLSSPEE